MGHFLLVMNHILLATVKWYHFFLTIILLLLLLLYFCGTDRLPALVLTAFRQRTLIQWVEGKIYPSATGI